MKVETGPNPFDGLDKGDVQLAMASEFFIRFRRILAERRDEHARQLENAAITAAAGVFNSAVLDKVALARGASLMAIDNIKALIADGEAYARS